ncbi:uncharacterized protein LOC110368069 isoform X2 [Fundulus heteroclitus]|uniref:uncharacterized protein LOC110368069 isoform X2 n=1 Tax=Fundulus heteroclitus TaxID=8078 RepID=UPI00165A8B0D|nr:uncharacterized protein LOC110368069 isoform X2 [Fundulus heteroclitus]
MAQSRKKQTVFQVYENKRKASEKRNKTRVYLGDSFPQWRALKALTGIPTDASFAKFLMDSYERSSQGCPPPSKDKAQPLRPPVSGVTSSSDPNSDQVCPTPCKGTDEPLRLPVSSVTGSSDPKSDHVYTTPCKGKDEPLRLPVSSVTGSSDPKSDHVYTTPCKGKDEPLRLPVSSVTGSSDPKSDRVYPTPCKGTDEPLGPPVSSVPGSCDPKRESVYIKEEPVVSSSNEVELDSMASLSDPSSELEQEVKTEPASCEDVSENKENKDEDGDISASLSVGDGYYLVDLGSSSEFVVDEACILELFRSCQRCSRHCRVMKRVQGLKIVVNQRCCYCDNRFEWTNLPDGFSDEEDGDLHITDRRQLTAA